MAAKILPGAERDGGRVPNEDLRLSLPIDETAAGQVRRALRGYLAARRVAADVVDAVVLATDEACINAIMHAGSGGRLHVRAHVKDGRLRVEVRDPGRGFAADRVDTLAPVDPMAPHGRGLYLIVQLMDDVHIESHPGTGTVVEMHKAL